MISIFIKIDNARKIHKNEELNQQDLIYINGPFSQLDIVLKDIKDVLHVLEVCILESTGCTSSHGLGPQCFFNTFQCKTLFKNFTFQKHVEKLNISWFYQKKPRNYFK